VRLPALVLAALSALAWVVPASAQDEEVPLDAAEAVRAEQEAIADVVESLVTSIGERGLVRFPEMSFPFMILLGGADPALAVIEAGDDPGAFDTESAGLVLSDHEVRMLGRVALVEFRFGPANEPLERADGLAVLCRPLDFWVVQAVGFAPFVPPDSEAGKRWEEQEPLCKDAVSALASRFGASLTTTGYATFEGLYKPFVAFDPVTGQFRALAEETDFDVPGDPLARTVTRVASTVLPGLARASVTCVTDACPLEFQLICALEGDDWYVVMAVPAPAELQADEAEAD